MTRLIRQAPCNGQVVAGPLSINAMNDAPPNTAPLDAIIVGGGPAGATAAILLARWGLRVSVLTRPAPSPALAESLPPSCVRLFDRLGVRDAIDSAGFVRSTGNTVHWGGEAVRSEPFAPGLTGYQVRRDEFDALLLAHAERSGARVVRDANVRDVQVGEAKDAVVRFVTGMGDETVTARWVLDCTGRSGLLARRGWRRFEPGQRTMAIVGAWDRPDGWELEDPSHTIVESYDNGWAWSVPVNQVRRLVTVMVDPARTPVAARAALADTYRDELARLRAIPSIIARAVPHGDPWARDASSYTADRAAAPGLLLVGDAASFIDPLSSFGVKKAIASAWLAAVVVRSVQDDPSLLLPALELHEEREREISGALRRRLTALARDAAGGHAPGFWDAREVDESVTGQPAEPDVAALSKDPGVLAAFADIRSRDAVSFTAGEVRQRRRPTVRDDRVVLEDHLVLPAFPQGVRHLRNIDLLRLIELAPRSRQVPDLFDSFVRHVAPVPLPDFLGALSVLLAQGALRLDSPRSP